MHQIRFPLGHVAVFKGPTSKGKRKRKDGERGVGRNGRKGSGENDLIANSWLRHWTATYTTSHENTFTVFLWYLCRCGSILIIHSLYHFHCVEDSWLCQVRSACSSLECWYRTLNWRSTCVLVHVLCLFSISPLSTALSLFLFWLLSVNQSEFTTWLK